MNKIQLQKTISKYTPLILTTTSIVGLVTTVVLAIKATPKALERLNAYDNEWDKNLSKTDIVKIALPAYYTTLLSGVATAICITGAYVVQKKQQATLISAYTAMQRLYSDYKQSTNEVYGKEGEHKILENISNKKDINELDYEDDDLFFDDISMRFYTGKLEDMLSKESQFLHDYKLTGVASVNNYFEAIGLPATDYGDTLGWSNIDYANGIIKPDELEFEYIKSKHTDTGKEYWLVLPTVHPYEYASSTYNLDYYSRR